MDMRWSAFRILSVLFYFGSFFRLVRCFGRCHRSVFEHLVPEEAITMNLYGIFAFLHLIGFYDWIDLYNFIGTNEK